MKKLGNSGFTLIEAMIAMAIIVIMIAGGVSGFGFLDLANASKCSAKIDTGLTKLKSQNMSKTSSVYMHLYYYDNDYYILLKDFFENQDLSTIPAKCVSVGVRRKDGAFTNTATPTSSIKVVRASDSGTAHEITLVTSTGKHFID